MHGALPLASVACKRVATHAKSGRTKSFTEIVGTQADRLHPTINDELGNLSVFPDSKHKSGIAALEQLPTGHNRMQGVTS
jgi:hypothetical protein